jgi:PPK2 family polyphosphate:nucleotide phosphotransferase
MDFRKRFRVKPGRAVSLRSWDPDNTASMKGKSEAEELLARGVERLSSLQERLYAENRRSLLIILQAMDAAGKDSTIKHVMSGVNPQGCQVTSFKAPTREELDHDYLWRTTRALPARGMIGIHNRSHYEEVLVTRVHPELLEQERLPDASIGPKLWRRRFREINRFERYLADNGTVILKFFLHVSREEQRQRFLDRMAEPEKYWKFQPGDVRERERWSDYMAAYEDVFRHTSQPWAPWFIIPADHKWFSRLAVADIIAGTLESMKVQYPTVSKKTRSQWRTLRAALENH